jgi:hypothetical protein
MTKTGKVATFEQIFIALIEGYLMRHKVTPTSGDLDKAVSWAADLTVHFSRVVAEAREAQLKLRKLGHPDEIGEKQLADHAGAGKLTIEKVSNWLGETMTLVGLFQNRSLPLSAAETLFERVEDLAELMEEKAGAGWLAEKLEGLAAKYRAKESGSIRVLPGFGSNPK